MLVLLRQALANAEEFDSFHSRLLEHCVPERQVSQLKLDRYEREQREGSRLLNIVRPYKTLRWFYA